jgi:hypothetical protein
MIVEASNVGVKVGMVCRGVIVAVGGIGVGLGVKVAGMSVGVAEGEGGVLLSTVAGAGLQVASIKTPLSRPINVRFIVCLPLLFLLSSFLFFYLNGTFPSLVPPKS